MSRPIRWITDDIVQKQSWSAEELTAARKGLSYQLSSMVGMPSWSRCDDWPAEVVRKYGEFTPTKIRVMSVIITNARRCNGVCALTVDDISHRALVTKATVHSTRKQAVELGLVVPEKRSDRTVLRFTWY